MEHCDTHFIAICSLYRVIEKNSQEKNARSNVYSIRARELLPAFLATILRRTSLRSCAAILHALKSRMNTGDFIIPIRTTRTALRHACDTHRRRSLRLRHQQPKKKFAGTPVQSANRLFCDL
jgi:hypothetical protein